MDEGSRVTVTKTDSLRKAAVLVASLDREAADTLLDQIPQEQAAQIRQMIVGIDSVSGDEARNAIEDFLRVDEDRKSAEIEHDVTEDFDESSLNEPVVVASAKRDPASSPSLEQLLDNAPNHALAELLQEEQPQTIAIVLVRLSAERASDIVAQLPIDKQAEVLQRLVETDRLATQLGDGIAAEFEGWLYERLQSAEQKSQLVARLSKLMSAAPAETRQRILTNLATSDSHLSQELGFVGTGEFND